MLHEVSPHNKGAGSRNPSIAFSHVFYFFFAGMTTARERGQQSEQAALVMNKCRGDTFFTLFSYSALVRVLEASINIGTRDESSHLFQDS